MHRSTALLAARSDSWEQRADAAEALVMLMVDDEEADAAVAALLGDEDLWVIRRAAAALLANPTAHAVGRFTSAYATASDQVGDHMNDELRVAASLNLRVQIMLATLADQGDVGARWLWLGSAERSAHAAFQL